MQNNDKKYFIPVDGTPIEVSEEIYRAYYQPIWNTRYHAQKNGECRCTKAQLWKCDGVCPGCPFYAAGKKVSIDTPIGGEEDELTLGDTLADDAPSAESILTARHGTRCKNWFGHRKTLNDFLQKKKQYRRTSRLDKRRLPGTDRKRSALGNLFLLAQSLTEWLISFDCVCWCGQQVSYGV